MFADMVVLSVCPGCGSDLLQPLGWEQHADGEVLVELRCPECYAWVQISHTQAEMRALDRLHASFRDELRCAYEARVAENMEALADSLRDAFERDLLGPDDFAPRLSDRRRVRPDQQERRKAA